MEINNNTIYLDLNEGDVPFINKKYRTIENYNKKSIITINDFKKLIFENFNEILKNNGFESLSSFDLYQIMNIDENGNDTVYKERVYLDPSTLIESINKKYIIYDNNEKAKCYLVFKVIDSKEKEMAKININISEITNSQWNCIKEFLNIKINENIKIKLDSNSTNINNDHGHTSLVFDKNSFIKNLKFDERYYIISDKSSDNPNFLSKSIDHTCLLPFNLNGTTDLYIAQKIKFIGKLLVVFKSIDCNKDDIKQQQSIYNGSEIKSIYLESWCQLLLATIGLNRPVIQILTNYNDFYCISWWSNAFEISFGYLNSFNQIQLFIDKYMEFGSFVSSGDPFEFAGIQIYTIREDSKAKK